MDLKIEQIDVDLAENFRRGVGGKYDRDVGEFRALFAAHRLAERERIMAMLDSAEMVEAVAWGMALVISRRHNDKPDFWMGDTRREEAHAAIAAIKMKL
jgi:hypothetical protein